MIIIFVWWIRLGLDLEVLIFIVFIIRVGCGLGLGFGFELGGFRSIVLKQIGLNFKLWVKFFMNLHSILLVWLLLVILVEFIAILTYS